MLNLKIFMNKSLENTKLKVNFTLNIYSIFGVQTKFF